MEKSLLGKKIAVLVETEYIHAEIEFYKTRIPELGGEVMLLSYLWGNTSLDIVNDIDSPEVPVTSAHRLTITECVTKHDPNEFDIVICAANYVAVRLREIPPMGSLGSRNKATTAPAVSFFARAMENKKIVKGAMCHALWILTPRKDLLRGRKVICHTVVLSDIVNAGAIFIPEPSHVVVDVDLVTARSFADIEPYFNALVTTSNLLSEDIPSYESTTAILNDTVSKLTNALQSRFNIASFNFQTTRDAVSAAAQDILDDNLDLSSEVRRITGVDFDISASTKRNPIIIVASKFGTWASEFTIVAGVLLKAGYEVKVATEDGSPPHFLSASLDTKFQDGAWRCSVVSEAEQRLALKFLNPDSAEHRLLEPINILNLSKLPAPPQIGDYLNAPSLLEQYEKSLQYTCKIAENYDALIIAGGSGAIPGVIADRGLHNLILAFDNLGKPIMGECNGGLAIAQTLNPRTGRSILEGRAVTTHSLLDEYQSGWGWVSEFKADPDSFWKNGQFDFDGYAAAEVWHTPGVKGNPIIDSEALFTNAAGPNGLFFSPPGSPYSVVVDRNLITCRTTPDGYPGTLALIAVLDGRPFLTGRLFIDNDRLGRRQPAPLSEMPLGWIGPNPLEVVREGDIGLLIKWLEEGGDPDYTDTEGWTPLLIAAVRGNSSIVNLLLFHEIPNARHANPDIRFPGADGLPIYMAGQSGDIATVKILLRARSEHLFDVATVNGHTLLLQAAFYGQKRHQELAVYLLENIAAILSIDTKDSSAIAKAQTRLLAATNVRGQNALALAKAYNVKPMVELLERYDYTTEKERADYYFRLLRRIAPPAPRNEFEWKSQELTNRLITCIELGLSKAANMPEDESVNDSVLEEIDKLLNDKNLAINRLGGPLQRTPIIIACTGPDVNEHVQNLRGSIVDKLLEYNANPLIHEVHAMGINAIIRAAVWGHLYLLERFVKVMPKAVFTSAINEKPLINGFTALHDSVHRGLSASEDLFRQYLSQIVWLLKHGAKYDIEDNSGKTQEDIARIALSDPDFKENARKILDVIHKN